MPFTTNTGFIHFGDVCKAILGRSPSEVAGKPIDKHSLARFVKVLVGRGRTAGRLNQSSWGSRYLIGYNMACVHRNIEQVQDYFLSLPASAFVEQRQDFSRLLLDLLVYSAEIVLPLEASQSGAVLYGHEDGTSFDDEAAAGLLSLAAELEPLIEGNMLHVPVCHFYYDGIKSLSQRMDGLRRLGFCDRNALQEFFVTAGPEARADIGVSLFCRSDLSTDLEDEYVKTCAALKQLVTPSDEYARWSEPGMLDERRAVFFVELDPIKLPHFQPRSIERLHAIRTLEPIRRLHRLMEQIDLSSKVVPSVSPADHFRRSGNHSLSTLTRDLRQLAKDSSIREDVSAGTVTVRHGVLLMELPQALPQMGNQSFWIGFGTGSGLHMFRHWLARRITRDGKWTVALVLRYIHLDD